MQDSPLYPWVLSLGGSSPAWPSLRGSGLCQGNAQLDCGGCILFLELCCTGRHRKMGSMVTYFRGFLSYFRGVLCYYSNEGASKHYGLLVKSFAFHQSQKPEPCKEMPGHCKKRL